MPQWNPESYLAFADHRSRPYAELLQRVPPTVTPHRIADLGCGPGHLSALLRNRWADATILGVDSSTEMIHRAESDNADPRIRYALADLTAWTPGESYEMIISNATFQWVPNDLAVIARLSEYVTPGGCFAISVPNNFSAPSHQLLHEISARPPYAEHTTGLHNARGRDPQSLLAQFADAGWEVDAWTTVYQQILPGEDPVLRWISGTGARPILQALPEPLRTEFTTEYAAALRDAYPQRPYGTVLPFERTFCVALRPQAVAG
ncbi:methyltransferase domain-containing protein [Propionibacteriaceae bacterium Y1685]|uniref:methyltransferase domain-containing protein n=1 Tax=Microlunatus sp. Y1700 TaxID=3418487 RepID=UPI003B790E4A